jgi:hypothetical protein
MNRSAASRARRRYSFRRLVGRQAQQRAHLALAHDHAGKEFRGLVEVLDLHAAKLGLGLQEGGQLAAGAGGPAS